MIDLGIVFYNRPEFVDVVLHRLFASIDANEMPVRLFVADNSDSDETRNKLVAHNRRFERLLLSGSNSGLARSLNELMAMMDADYFALMDCDVLVPPVIWDKLADVLAKLDTVGAVCPIWRDPIEDCTKKMFARDVSRHSQYGFRISPASNVAVVTMLRKEFALQVGNFSEFGSGVGWGCETDISRRILATGKEISFLHDVEAIHLPNTIGDNPEHAKAKQQAKALAKENFNKAWPITK